MHRLHGKFARTSADTNVLQAVHIARIRVAALDKRDKAMMPSPAIPLSRHNSVTPARGHGPVDRRIRAFLNGEGHGEDVLGALYGDIAHEPIPEKLRALLKR
jgi:hypothetical protein